MVYFCLDLQRINFPSERHHRFDIKVISLSLPENSFYRHFKIKLNEIAGNVTYRMQKKTIAEKQSTLTGRGINLMHL